MKLQAVLVPAIVLFAACAPNVRPCAEGTLFVSVSLDAQTKQADRLQVQISVGSGAPMLTTLDHVVGKDQGSIEIQFPNGYPVGQTIHVTLIAVAGGSTLGQATFEATLTAGCGSAEIAIGSSVGPDLAGTDIVLPIDLTPPSPDLLVPGEGGVEIDLAGTDIVPPVVEDLANPTNADLTPACTPTTENCFNGIDDDCDLLPDCADPDCAPTAICVPPPTGSFKLGTKIAGAAVCTTYPTATTIRSGFISPTCGTGSCACQPGSDSGGTCFSALMNAGSDFSCGGGSSPVNVEPGMCLQVTPPASISYHYTFEGYIPGTTCGTSGAPSGVPAGFAQTSTFCSRPETTGGAGCSGGNLCVPKALNQCVISPGQLIACPSGYTSDSTAHFTGHDSGQTCACRCTMNPGTCTKATVFASNDCTGGIYPNTCSNQDLTTTAVSVLGGTLSTLGQCGSAGFFVSGTTTPTGPQTVCCTP